MLDVQSCDHHVINDEGSISLRAYITASPEKGKANARLIKLLSETLGVRKANIEILRGHTSNKKIISVVGIAFEKAHEALRAITD